MATKYNFDEQVQIIDTMLHVSTHLKTAIMNNNGEVYIYTSDASRPNGEKKIGRTRIGGTADLSGLEKELTKLLLPHVAQNTAFQLYGILFCEEADITQLSPYVKDESVPKEVSSTNRPVPGIDSIR